MVTQFAKDARGNVLRREVQAPVDDTVLDPNDLKNLRAKAKQSGSERYANAQRELVNILGVARSNALGRVDELVQQQLDMRDFTLERRIPLVDTGDYVDFALNANKLKLFSVLSSAPQPTQQPAGEAVAYSLLKIFVETSVTVETIEELVQKLGVRVRYNDGREPWEFPLRDCLKTGVRNPNAGTAFDAQSAIEGTRTEVIELGRDKRMWGMAGEDTLVILPGDAQDNLEFFWLTDYAAAPPAQPAGGEAGDIFLFVEVVGKLWKSIKRK